MDSLSVFQRLDKVIHSRKSASPTDSYVAKLFAKGSNEILKKVIEEAGEVVLASKDGNKKGITGEVADLWFHVLVLLAYHDIHPDSILDELEGREGLSGIVEKDRRTNS